MLKLVYEGDKLYQLLDLIKDSHFVVMDWDNHLPYQAEAFCFALDSIDQLNWLKQLPDGMAVYLAPSVRQRVNRSDFPGLIFQEQLEGEMVWPKRLHLSGDIEVCLEFTAHLLKQVPFCVGFVAEDYRLEKIQEWRHAKHYRFNDQFQPASRQNLILEYTPSPEPVSQIYFWNGSPEAITLLRQQLGTIPTGMIIACVGKRPKKSDRLRLPYVTMIPKFSLARKRAFDRLLEELLDPSFHAMDWAEDEIL